MNSVSDYGVYSVGLKKMKKDRGVGGIESI